MKLPSYQDAVFVLDPAAGLTDGNLWRDSGKRGLHWTPGAAYVAPNYGYAVSTANGAPYVLAGGAANFLATLADANQRARMYAAAPTTGMTFVLAQRFSVPTAADIVFGCLNAAATRGLQLDFATADRLRIVGRDGAGAALSVSLTAAAPFTGPRTRVVILSMDSTQGLARAWLDGEGVGAAHAGSTNPVAYDDTVIPTLFASVGGAVGYNDGQVFFAGWWPFVVSDSEARVTSRWLLDRT